MIREYTRLEGDFSPMRGTKPVQKKLELHVSAPNPLISRPSAMRQCQLIHSFGKP